ncbi:MAG: orotidine 5'-phosphate decarboxylase, partial [Actinobacteria bacterium]
MLLGLDPDPAALWPEAAGADSTVARVARHCRAAIDAVDEACVGVKLQFACFERLGPAGWTALAEVAAYAADRGHLVLGDGKRGDVPVTAKAYAEAYFGEAGPGFDAVTASPL